MEGALIVFAPHRAAGALHRLSRRRSSCRSRAPTSSSGSAAITATLNAGFHILVPFVDVIRYRHSLKETGDRHPGAGLHHARQRAGRRRRHPVPEGAQPGARVLRHLGLHVRHHRSWRRRRCAARSARSISIGRSKSARPSTSQVVGELDKASEPWGVKVLRYEIKNITAAAGRPGGDGKADARRAREARRDSDVGRAARRRHQHRRRREAAGDQGVGGARASSRSTKPKARRRRSSPSRRPRPRASAQVAEAIQHRRRHGSGAAARRRAVRGAVRQAGAEDATPSSCPRTSSDVAGMIAAAMKVFGSAPPPTPPRSQVPPPPPRG